MHLGEEARIDVQQAAHIVRHLLQLDLGTPIEPYINLVDRRDRDDNPARTDGWGVFVHAVRMTSGDGRVKALAARWAAVLEFLR